ncbi:hypothetical protein VA7868_04589 [Vibrio aerogenes CECT 7868]|uniref:DUF2931 family protein n=1 Tax=Vibrio aerogenes CECT 7868 TaxID=1216006 RepID=A0A1M6F6Z0_9VIBR|nr:DUF2931 family protein [Vibrio aerogenes]SHI93431.1 hypothetical protein VA7868_04589 [Vibrio aerogenes CECT 7868]
MQPICRSLIKMLSVVIIGGCASSPPKDMPVWEITIATPSFYSVGVIEAYGVNEKEDWTVLVHSFMQISWRNGIDRAKEWLSNNSYDGFGIPLNPLVNITSRQIGSGTKVLPESIYIFWISYIHQPKFYVTKYDVPEKVRQFIQTRRTYIRRDGVKRPCYKTDFVFGLLPNGHAKVWLEGCATYTYVTELPPALEPERDYNGFTLDHYRNPKSGTKRTVIDRAKKAGVTIDPIPWDKVNQVYWNKKRYKVDSIEDYQPKAEQ